MREGVGCEMGHSSFLWKRQTFFAQKAERETSCIGRHQKKAQCMLSLQDGLLLQEGTVVSMVLSCLKVYGVDLLRRMVVCCVCVFAACLWMVSASGKVYAKRTNKHQSIKVAKGKGAARRGGKEKLSKKEREIIRQMKLLRHLELLKKLEFYRHMKAFQKKSGVKE